ncbi:hypothetical protein F4781DRAFT_365244 [Annulohypoxylon bovei var. microspora]|nr:hypothetical protein F4781DRAFT_365244 [Annulohypoxylon bovei var. microspora]
MAMLRQKQSLCFYETWDVKKAGKISDDQYYHYLLDHFTGKTHEDDINNCTGKDKRLNRQDMLADLVQDMAKEIEHVEDAAAFESVFKAYHTGTLEDVVANHDSLDEKHAKYICQLLATRALLDRRADVLQFCLDRGGFDYESNFKFEANTVYEKNHPKTFTVLEASKFREVHPRQDPPWIATDIGGAFLVD